MTARLEMVGPAAVLTLDAPPLNVLDQGLMEELERRVAESEALPAHALLLRAEGKAFCAGVDVEAHLGERLGPMLRTFHRLSRRLLDHPLPTLARVHGAALGGGCELALACDLILAAEEASFGQPEIRLGVFPPMASVHLPRRVPYARAAALLLTGRTVDGREAARLGLATVAVPLEELDGEVTRWLEELAPLSRSSLRLAKRALRLGLRGGPAEALEAVESLYLEELAATHDATEGLVAFLEKRPARWTHD